MLDSACTLHKLDTKLFSEGVDLFTLILYHDEVLKRSNGEGKNDGMGCGYFRPGHDDT